MNDLYIPAGSSADGAFDTVIDPGARTDWVHTGLRVMDLGPGQSARFTATGVELMALPLSGGADILTFVLADRALRGWILGVGVLHRARRTDPGGHRVLLSFGVVLIELLSRLANAGATHDRLH